MSTLEQVGEALQAFKEGFTTHCTQVRTVFEQTKTVVYEETRQRHLAEVTCFFPDHLMHVQCRKCTADKLCWQGHTQGFLCGAFWMGNSQHPDVIARLDRLRNLTTRGDLEAIIATGDFYDILGLCYLWQANLRILPVVNLRNIRILLEEILEHMHNPSIYLLTSVENDFIFTNETSPNHDSHELEGAIDNIERNLVGENEYATND